MDKQLRHTTDCIEIDGYEIANEYLLSERDNLFSNIYNLLNEISKFTEYEYKMGVKYLVPKDKNSNIETIRRVDLRVYVEDPSEEVAIFVDNIMHAVEDNKMRFKGYNEDAVRVSIYGGENGWDTGWIKGQTYEEYESKSVKLMQLDKSNMQKDSIKFFIQEEIDKITGRVYRTTLVDILDLFYRLLDKGFLENCNKEELGSISFDWIK